MVLLHLPTLDPYKIIAQHIGQLHGIGVSERPAPQLAGQVGDASAPAVFIGQQLHHLRHGHTLPCDVGFHFVATSFFFISMHIGNSFLLYSLYGIMSLQESKP